MRYIDHPRIVELLKHKIEQNFEEVMKTFETVDNIIAYYQENPTLLQTEMGKFFKYYSASVSKINRKSKKQILKLFYTLLHYPNLLSACKEILYIFSDYRACVYYMTPTIDFYNTDKKTMDSIVHSFKDNLNTMNQIVSRIYLGDANPWGSPYYASAFAMYETLHILHLYYSDPLNVCGIGFQSRIRSPKEAERHIQEKRNQYDIQIRGDWTYSTVLISLKKKGYDLWFAIPFLMDCIYSSYEFEHIPISLIWESARKVSQQRNNNLLGVMIYVLVVHGTISNLNLLKRFND
jgi:hypothetical protein